MNKPSIAELEESGRFRLVESFSIDDMKQFLLQELGMSPAAQKPPARLTFRRILLFLILGGIGGFIGVYLAQHSVALPWWQLGLAVVVLFLLMPIHEAIHALVFKLYHAPDVGFGYSVQSLMIYAYAQRFVLTLTENAVVAAMPFLVITTALVGAWLVWPVLGLLWGTVLALHSFLCVGDYVLVKYAVKNRHRAMFTYDDLQEQKSYFYERIPGF